MKVADMTAAAVRLAARLQDNTGGIPVKVGWDGERIAAFAGTYKSPVKSLPVEALVIPFHATVDEVETSLAMAVLRVRRALAPLMKDGRPVVPHKVPARGHHWRRR